MEGKISYVAQKTGGFKIQGNEDWLNPIKALVPVTMNLEKGSTITYTLNSEGKVSEIIPHSVDSLPTNNTIISTPVVKAPDWDAKEKRIIRQSSIKAASELVISGKVELDLMYLVADKIVEWVYSGVS